MNWIFLGMVVLSVLFAAVGQLTGIFSIGETPMDLLSMAIIDAAKNAVVLALGLIGIMTFFLGLMKVVEAGGGLTIMARLIRPLLTKLFPEVPPDHPAMGAMVLNLSANALGLGNAATPFGIRAMQQLDTLNPEKGTATNTMALFLAINTSSVTLLPTGVIALRAASGSMDPAGILPTTLFATVCSTTVAVLGTFFYKRFFKKSDPMNPNRIQKSALSESTEALSAENTSTNYEAETAEVPEGYPAWVSILCLAGFLALAAFLVLCGGAISPWILPILAVSFLIFGVIRKVRVYETFVEGAKDGFQVAVRIIPYLVAILVAVEMLKVSGGLDFLVGAIGGLTVKFGLPPEALPMALLRPLSGSGAYGVLASTIADPAIGPDSYIGYLVSTIQGSTETTFYVLAVYFGAIGVRRYRHTLLAALTADVAGIMGAVVACLFLFGFA